MHAPLGYLRTAPTYISSRCDLSTRSRSDGLEIAWSPSGPRRMLMMSVHLFVLSGDHCSQPWLLLLGVVNGGVVVIFPPPSPGFGAINLTLVYMYSDGSCTIFAR
ncbi:hypothetical protein BO71DRAFT_397525 [Aspergillus ellipticus CBS 707.79]|uniref:Uncharacterized protein n=1 Tax=Aspergillus ellipticus CBS 707.79 TaxID=1448320 RepID=A0A319DPI1_9EURO|nr:hypothetical protein BO71DRAFT_397525 [Aspergillus ellipticus CBS 707.79]